MRVPTPARDRGVRFNLTPLIDIVFLLLIFFLVASYLSAAENAEALELTKAATSRRETEEAPRRVMITVTAEGVWHIAGQPIGQQDFDLLLDAERGKEGTRDVEVRIRADRRVPFRTVEPLLISCARHGIRKVKFNVLPKE